MQTYYCTARSRIYLDQTNLNLFPASFVLMETYFQTHILLPREKGGAKKLISIPEMFSYLLCQSSSQPILVHHLVRCTAGTSYRMTDWGGSNQSSLDWPIPISQDSHLIRPISSLFSFPSVGKLAQVMLETA